MKNDGSVARKTPYVLALEKLHRAAIRAYKAGTAPPPKGSYAKYMRTLRMLETAAIQYGKIASPR